MGAQASRAFVLNAAPNGGYLYGEPGTMSEKSQHVQSLLRALSGNGVRHYGKPSVLAERRQLLRMSDC